MVLTLRPNLLLFAALSKKYPGGNTGGGTTQGGGGQAEYFAAAKAKQAAAVAKPVKAAGPSKPALMLQQPPPPAAAKPAAFGAASPAKPFAFGKPAAESNESLNSATTADGFPKVFYLWIPPASGVCVNSSSQSLPLIPNVNPFPKLGGGSNDGKSSVPVAKPFVFGSPAPAAAAAAAVPAFGAARAPAFGAAPAPAFGAAAPAAAGSFGSPKPAFGAPAGGGAFEQPAAGTKAPFVFKPSPRANPAPALRAFGAAPVFAAPGVFGAAKPAFGAASPSSPAQPPPFGGSPNPAFSTSLAKPALALGAFGAAPAFAAPGVFGGAPKPAFGAASPLKGAAAFGSAASPSVCAQNRNRYGTVTAAALAGQPALAPVRDLLLFAGSCSPPYAPVAWTPTAKETDSSSPAYGKTGAQHHEKLMRISAMPAYAAKSPEELRMEDRPPAKPALTTAAATAAAAPGPFGTGMPKYMSPGKAAAEGKAAEGIAKFGGAAIAPAAGAAAVMAGFAPRAPAVLGAVGTDVQYEGQTQVKHIQIRGSPVDSQQVCEYLKWSLLFSLMRTRFADWRSAARPGQDDFPARAVVKNIYIWIRPAACGFLKRLQACC